MRVEAQNDADLDNRDLTVTTEVGVLRGKWSGDRPISRGETVDVELDFDRPRYWSDLEFLTDSAPVGADRIVGTITSVYDDRVIAVQIGRSAAQIEMLDDPPGEMVGRAVVLAADDLEFSPSGI